MRIANLWFWGSMVVFAGSFMAPAHAQVCTGNADCPAPLTCKEGASICSQTGGMLPDGGIYVSDPVCQPGLSKCTWSFVRCQADSECTTLAQWACLLVPDQTVIKTCFPKAIACSADQSCPTGWSCLDLSQWEEGDEPLDVWNVKSGTQFCWPDSLKAVLDNTAKTDASGLGLPSSGDGASVSTSDAGIAGGSSDAGVALGSSDGGVARGPSTAESASSNKGSGCTIARGHNPSACLAMLALALAGLVALGRKMRRR